MGTAEVPRLNQTPCSQASCMTARNLGAKRRECPRRLKWINEGRLVCRSRKLGLPKQYERWSANRKLNGISVVRTRQAAFRSARERHAGPPPCDLQPQGDIGSVLDLGGENGVRGDNPAIAPSAGAHHGSTYCGETAPSAGYVLWIRTGLDMRSWSGIFSACLSRTRIGIECYLGGLPWR